MSGTPPSETGFRASLRAIDAYWFGKGSPTTLGLFRIMVGLLSFANCVLLSMTWESWFSDKGYIPAWIAQRWLSPTVPIWYGGKYQIPRLNIISGISDPRITIPFLVILAIVSLTTALGLWTKFSSIVMAVGIVSMQHRDAAILHGGDSVIRLWCVYLAVSPCGEACSLDRLIGLWRGKIAPGPVRVSLWSQRLITYNLALIYFTTIWNKYDGNLWRGGIATYFPARLAEFFRFPYPHFVNNVPFVWFSTYGTLIVEFSMGTLVFFRPLRKYVLIGGLMMHGWIDYSMNIPLFSYYMCCAYLCFYEGEEVTAWAKRVGARLRRFNVRVNYPLGMRLRGESAAFLKAVDPFDWVSYAPSDTNLWQAARADGTPIRYTVASWSRSVGAYAFAWIPGLWQKTLDRSLMPIPADAGAPSMAESYPPHEGSANGETVSATGQARKKTPKR